MISITDNTYGIVSDKMKDMYLYIYSQCVPALIGLEILSIFDGVCRVVLMDLPPLSLGVHPPWPRPLCDAGV